jgi:hypothetical protein
MTAAHAAFSKKYDDAMMEENAKGTPQPAKYKSEMSRAEELDFNLERNLKDHRVFLRLLEKQLEVDARRLHQLQEEEGRKRAAAKRYNRYKVAEMARERERKERIEREAKEREEEEMEELRAYEELRASVRETRLRRHRDDSLGAFLQHSESLWCPGE